MLCRRLLLLKPLSPGLSGYARLQWEGGRTEMQIQLRGLSGGGVRFFWYQRQARELGQATVNPRGEACLTASLAENLLSPKGLQALLILSAEESPRPLMLGLPGPADGGALLEMRAASLALCQQLAKKPETPKAQSTAAARPAPTDAPALSTCQQLTKKPETPKAQSTVAIRPAPTDTPALSTCQQLAQKLETPKAQSPTAIRPAPANTPAPPPCPRPTQKPESAASADTARPQRNPTDRPELPREIFLPAIDPAPYMAAQERPPEKQSPQRPWADALPALRWPEGFETLRPFFDAGMPCALLDAPGWRFVRAADAGGPQGLFLGLFAQDGAVRQLAYAHPGDHPPAPSFRPVIGLDGKTYQVLWQRVQ